jgi:hypothetical protein
MSNTTTEVSEAAKALVEKLHLIHADPTFQSVWTLSHLRSGPYTGPQYDKELAALEAALSTAPSGDGVPGMAEADAVCMWADKPCTCGGGDCEQVDFGGAASSTGKETPAPAHEPGTIRVCPMRDAICPHGMSCPYTDGYDCKPGWWSQRGTGLAG